MAGAHGTRAAGRLLPSNADLMLIRHSVVDWMIQRFSVRVVTVRNLFWCVVLTLVFHIEGFCRDIPSDSPPGEDSPCPHPRLVWPARSWQVWAVSSSSPLQLAAVILSPLIKIGR